MQRNTIQRTLILDAMQKLDHPTAEQVYNQVSANFPTISKGTVYRNLAKLVENNLLQKLTMPYGADHYDITLKSHYHAYCTTCGKLIDIDTPYQNDLFSSLPEVEGFTVEGHDLLIRGCCKSCKKL